MFHEYEGITRKGNSAISPLDYFCMFFTRAMFTAVAEQTNLYNTQVNLKKTSPMKWIRTSAEEMMAFIGVVIAMGIANLPELDDYWQTKGIFHMPWFSAIFSRNRFKQILRYLHLVDNSENLQRTDPNYNKLFKLGDISEKLNIMM